MTIKIHPQLYRLLIKLKNLSKNCHQTLRRSKMHPTAIKQAALKVKHKEKKSGGPNANLMLTYKNGQLFTRVVIDAYRGGLILPTEASSLLNTAVNNFSKLEAFV